MREKARKEFRQEVRSGARVKVLSVRYSTFTTGSQHCYHVNGTCCRQVPESVTCIVVKTPHL
ncbi:hypothetical protein [Microbulbifer sediminum]|uniref:hypothetical protein n=1 Tax=Microbulbifer sediminum TaxID=2904250 RepID=UPI001F490BC0|nr:hypothetical protein [Microbulbifer sediminum]